MTFEVSVIIPCYNAEGTIGRCINSVLSQSFESFEILVVDDASSDGTLSRVESYDDPRLRILELESNSGSPAGPRNVGLREARGSFVAFLDSDDFWNPEKLLKQIEFMKESNCRFSCTDYIVRDEAGNEYGREARAEARLNDLLALNTVGCSTVMIARDLISGFEFEDRPHEDFDMWLRILKQGNIVYGLNEALTTYSKRKTSRSRLSIGNLIGFHALFRFHGEVGNLGAFMMMARYLLKKRSQSTQRKA